MSWVGRWISRMSLITLVLLCLGASPTPSDRSERRGVGLPMSDCEGPGQALDIESEQMTFDSKSHTFVFERNVTVRRCDMTLKCNRLRVINTADGKGVERIIATGNVQIEQGTRQARADKAEYFDAEQKLVLTGQPRAWDTEDQNELTGDVMEVFLATEKLEVKRARVLFHPRRSTPTRPGG